MDAHGYPIQNGYGHVQVPQQQQPEEEERPAPPLPPPQQPQAQPDQGQQQQEQEQQPQVQVEVEVQGQMEMGMEMEMGGVRDEEDVVMKDVSSQSNNLTKLQAINNMIPPSKELPSQNIVDDVQMTDVTDV